MKISQDTKKLILLAVNSQVTEGEKFVSENIIPLIESVVKDAFDDENIKNVEIKIIKDSDGDEKTRMYIQKNNETNKKTFCININALNSDYAGFKKGEHYSASVGQKNYRIMDIIVKIFHEVRHLKQYDIIEEKNLERMSPLALIYAKEVLIATFDKNWYASKHSSFYIEIESQKVGYQKMKELINLTMSGSNFCEKCTKEALAAEKYYSDKISNYMQIAGRDISDKADQIMKEQNTLDVLQKYKSLNFIYKNDGTKRSYSELIGVNDKVKNQFKQKMNEKINVDGIDTTIGANFSKVFTNIISTDREYFQCLIQKIKK